MALSLPNRRSGGTVVPEMMMNVGDDEGGGGCEIEARGISFKIITPSSSTARSPFRVWTRDDDDSQVRGEKVAVDHEENGTNYYDDKGEGGGRGDHVRHVLKDVSCKAKPWEVLAVVGPSGAGKSTLLEVLAGKLPLPASPPALFVDGKPIDDCKFRKISGYVTQTDVLFPLLTVRETLLFSARLRLRLSGPEIAARVDSLVQELGLERVADARVGDDRVRGVSGGERRRVSIGVEVVHDPRVLILDEPTSGLDSAAALQIVDMLKSMAEVRGRTIVLSIHQPGFRIVKLFNSTLLMAGGSVVHHGTVEQLHAYVRSVGLEMPLHVNVVEFAMDAIDTLQQHKLMQQKKTALGHDNHGDLHDSKKRERCTLQDFFGPTTTNKAAADVVSPLCHGGYANSWLGETAILTHRYLKNVFRTKELFACRTIQMLVSGLVLGSIFYKLGNTTVGAMERVGLFAFTLTFLLSCTTEALPIFLQERQIIMKETSAGSYRLSSYVAANGLVFLPFQLILALLFSLPLYLLVGLNQTFPAFLYFLLLIWLILYTANSIVVCVSSVASDFIVGNSMVNGVMGAFFLFSGYFIRKEGIPSYWLFAHYISLFKYPFEGFLVNEFSGEGRCLEYRGGVCVVGGDQVLSEVGLGAESRWTNVTAMLGFIVFYRFLSYVLLKCRCRCAQKGGLRRVLS